MDSRSADYKASHCSEQWRRLQLALADAGEAVFADPRVDSPLLRAEATRYLMRLAQFAREAEVEIHDTAYPMLVKLESPYLQWGLPNPDYLYWYAHIDGAHRYRLHGRRGGCRMFTVETWSGDWSRIGEQKVLAYKAHVIDGSGELEVGADGSIEIVLSREPQPGNWLPIGDGIGTVLIRECFYDWEHEAPGQLYLEREGATYPAPPPTAAALEGHLEQMITFLSDAPRRLIKGVDLHYGAPPDRYVFPGLDGAIGTETGFPKQFYGRTHYRLAEGEAMIIEAEPPDCAFWSFMIGSPFWECGDWHLRSLSINAHQAWIDADGKFRAVVAYSDPGVSNWLDTGGHDHGTLTCRWNRLKYAKLPPVPTLRKVRFDQLRQELPADTPPITAAQRSELLRRRLLSVRRRRAD